VTGNPEVMATDWRIGTENALVLSSLANSRVVGNWNGKLQICPSLREGLFD